MRMEDVSDENAAPRRFTLYAGGGLLKESSCQTEWDETEAKNKINVWGQCYFSEQTGIPGLDSTIRPNSFLGVTILE
jgi:hypothetical protein